MTSIRRPSRWRSGVLIAAMVIGGGAIAFGARDFLTVSLGAIAAWRFAGVEITGEPLWSLFAGGLLNVALGAGLFAVAYRERVHGIALRASHGLVLVALLWVKLLWIGL